MQRFFKVFLILSLFTAFLASTTLAAETPTNQVKNILDQIMTIQNNPQLEGEAHLEQRKSAIKNVIARNFDFDSMAQLSLGNYWDKMSNSQRSEFKTVFRDLFQDSYTRLVLNFLKREKILYNKEESAQGRASVKTTIERTNDQIAVDYYLKPVNNKWLVTDVDIDGVSIAGNYRNAFTRVIKMDSFSGLMQKMRLQQKAVD